MSRRPLFVVGALVWAATLGAGFVALTRYDNAPGPLGTRTPSTWPALSHLRRTEALPTVVVMLHPRCPCSRAALANLERAMPELYGKARTYLVFVHYTPEDASELLPLAKGIPGADVFEDRDGREAELFGVLTSGETLLYSREGTLLFHGGITLGRSHEGDNPGLSAIVEFVRSGSAVRSTASVFGCTLAHSQEPSTAMNAPLDMLR